MAWKFEQVDGPYGGVTEGPQWDGSGLLFSHIPAQRIYRYDPKRKMSTVFRENTNYANGLMFDAQGRLHACEGGGRRVVRYEADGSVTALVNGYEGKRLNFPNDLAIHPDGRIWFTDPYYEGAAGPESETRANKDIEHDSVYRLDPRPHGGDSCTRVTFDTTRPNGILFSLDYKTLYVAQSGREKTEKKELRAYPVNPDRSLGKFRVLHDFWPDRGIDGMKLDTQGNIVATAGWKAGGSGPSIYVFSPDGKVLERHEVPVDRPTNCAWAEDDLMTLYVTTIEGYLFRVRTNRKGRVLFPATP
ncbi:MAG: SMP-30/gluconolactonase/LRE family protein [SAR202 cluster bacterium]|nr:SMP-30/gluconolactonase/LRE family protein [SAR202 cluster bacterium]